MAAHEESNAALYIHFFLDLYDTATQNDPDADLCIYKLHYGTRIILWDTNCCIVYNMSSRSESNAT